MLQAAIHMPDVPLAGGLSINAIAAAYFIVPGILGALAGKRAQISARQTALVGAAVPIVWTQGFWLLHPSFFLNIQCLALLVVFTLGAWAGYREVTGRSCSICNPIPDRGEPRSLPVTPLN